MLIKRPIVTEKNNELAQHQTYVFEVDLKANKTQIRSYVEKYFDVKVLHVRTSICRGRSKRTSRGVGRIPYWKKAIVRLQPNEKIKIFEGN